MYSRSLFLASFLCSVSWVQADPSGISQVWLEEVAEGIRRQEYNFSPVEYGAWSAPNRSQAFRIQISESGLRLTPRVGGDLDWGLDLRLIGYGRPGQIAALEPSWPDVTANKVEFWRPGILEWYLNTEDGLEQGFDIPVRPWQETGPGDPLVIDLAIAGNLQPYQDEGGGAVVFRTYNGVPVLRYHSLSVLDASGAGVPAYLVILGRGLRIVVHDQNADYPLRIDPLLSAPAWTAESNQASALFGLSVATAGDVNGDGYSDVIIGASGYDAGESDEGRVFVYHGRSAGLSTDPNWTAESNQVSAQFGLAVATAGDVNGDGYDEVVVGSPDYDNGETDEGRAFLWYGGTSGLGTNGDPLNADWSADANQTSAQFGYSVAYVGDINGDGYDDVIVGARSYGSGADSNEGWVFVYHGSASGFASTANWTAESDHPNAYFGTSVGTAGDINGDGYADVIVGAPWLNNGQTDEGKVFVWEGSSSGLGLTGKPGSSDWAAEGNQGNAHFGLSVGTAGDVDGDGYADVIVGSPDYDNGETDEGMIFVYLGSSTGLGANGTPSNADWKAESDQASASLGWSAGTAGDVNGDGFSDVFAGANAYDNGQTNEGRAFVWHGSPSGLGSNGTASNADWSGESDQASANYGKACAAAGDVNGDGFADLVAGADFDDNGETNEGRAYVYHGSAGGLGVSAGWTAESNQEAAYFGWSVAYAGDVNGDGYSDVIVGAPSYDSVPNDEGAVFVYLGSATGPATTASWQAESDNANSEFGTSVASAGDVNGDGFTDVIVGARKYDGGATDGGAAFVWYGSSTGLGSTGHPSNADWKTESSLGGEHLGWSVASAGDVNGDGYGDIIVGSRDYSNPPGTEASEGRAYVYHGASIGLPSTATWTAELNQGGAIFGVSVASAGDVNGDGYGDVIIGAAHYDNGHTDEGLAFVYHGSAMGLPSTADWTAEADRMQAELGSSVSTAGDVNGDGYSDVLVGAKGWANPSDANNVNEGGAFAWYGSSSGLGSSGTPSNADWSFESNLANAELGQAVSTAGDVNGDGYSDAVVGAPFYDNGQTDEGRAYVFRGSTTGLAASAEWTQESNQSFANFGFSVATAGDANGDGFSDVLIGTPFFTNGQGSEGRSFLYYGNDGDGLDRFPRQRRTDDVAPIEILGRSNASTAFRLKALGRTPSGRGKVRLQWEVKALGTAFNGTNLQLGSEVDTGTPGSSGSGVTLDESASGLSAATRYRWRLRILTNSPLFPRSPWFSHPSNNRTETDLRTAD